MAETCTRKEFAERMGWRSQGQVSNLIKQGLVKLTDDGKRVRVAESIAAIESARDPSKQGVRDRHAAMRAGEASPERHDYQDAKAKREHYGALTAEAEYRARMGELMEAAKVHAAVADVLVTLRGALEPMGAVLAPQLAASSDENDCRALVDDRVEAALAECARRFDEVGR